MRYEHINRICRCGNESTNIYNGTITKRDVLDKMDTCCDKCLLEQCRAQCTSISEWTPFTEKYYNKRNNENDKEIER